MTTPVKVFLADDDEDDLSFFEIALKAADANAILKTADNGQKLIDNLVYAGDEHPDLIFLDINMPCKTGHECLKEIRANNNLEKVPVIMFTTSNHPQEIEKAFNNGANLFVVKPANLQLLETILRKILVMVFEEDFLPPQKKRFLLGANKEGIYWKSIW